MWGKRYPASRDLQAPLITSLCLLPMNLGKVKIVPQFPFSYIAGECQSSVDDDELAMIGMGDNPFRNG